MHTIKHFIEIAEYGTLEVEQSAIGNFILRLADLDTTDDEVTLNWHEAQELREALTR